MDAASVNVPVPLPMLLFCPYCRQQHIDRPDESTGWTNPPHKTHLCEFCGATWTPSNIRTTGVLIFPPLSDKDHGPTRLNSTGVISGNIGYWDGMNIVSGGGGVAQFNDVFSGFVGDNGSGESRLVSLCQCICHPKIDNVITGCNPCCFPNNESLD